MATKYSITSCKDWESITAEEAVDMVANLMRIGVPEINEWNIADVKKRTKLANELNLQIPFMPPIKQVTPEQIDRFVGINTNIVKMAPQEWYPKVKKMFPWIFKFDRELERVHKAGWVCDDCAGNPPTWFVHNVDTPETSSAWFYLQGEYLTEKEVWQDLMSKGKV